MKIDTNLIKHITEMVMAKLDGCHNAASRELSGVLHVRERLITLQQLPESLEGIRTLVGIKGAVVTPSVRDVLRAKKIQLVTEEPGKLSCEKHENGYRKVLSLVGSKVSVGEHWSVIELSSREEVIRELTEQNQRNIPVVIAADPVELSAHLAKWASKFFLPLRDEKAMAALKEYRPNGWVIHPSLCTSENLERLDSVSPRE